MDACAACKAPDGCPAALLAVISRGATAVDLEKDHEATEEGYCVDPPLVEAASNNHVDIVVELLKLGVNTEAQGRGDEGTYFGDTALMAAARKGHAGIIKLLLEKGARVNKGTREASPLYCALGGGGGRPFFDAAEALLEAGASASFRSSDFDGSLLCSLIAWCGQMAHPRHSEEAHAQAARGAGLLDSLLAKGARPSNDDLMLACDFGWVQGLKLLLAAGGNPNAARWGQGTLLAMFKERRPEIAEVLRAFGGKE